MRSRLLGYLRGALARRGRLGNLLGRMLSSLRGRSSAPGSRLLGNRLLRRHVGACSAGSSATCSAAGSGTSSGAAGSVSATCCSKDGIGISGTAGTSSSARSSPAAQASRAALARTARIARERLPPAARRQAHLPVPRPSRPPEQRVARSGRAFSRAASASSPRTASPRARAPLAASRAPGASASVGLGAGVISSSAGAGQTRDPAAARAPASSSGSGCSRPQARAESSAEPHPVRAARDRGRARPRARRSRRWTRVRLVDHLQQLAWGATTSWKSVSSSRRRLSSTSSLDGSPTAITS